MKNNIKLLLEEALKKKTCIEYAVAAVIETLKGEYVLGWNGPPKSINHTKCLMNKQPTLDDLYLCPASHAERNAISRAAKKGIATDQSTIYLSGWFPCADCAKSIIDAGIKKFVTPDEVYLDKNKHILVPVLQNQPYNFEMAEKLMRVEGIEIIVDPSIKVK